LFDIPELRDRVRVFRDRRKAGEVLAGMLEAYRNAGALVLAVPAGGVPVAAVVAQSLDLVLDVVVVSKITLPWDTEVGYGAIAFDGTVRLNEDLIATMGLSRQQVEGGIAETTEKVQRRVKRFRGERPMPDLMGRTVILIDDGIASGFTLRVAIEAMRNARAREVVVATPTAHKRTLETLADAVDVIFCPNVRSGGRFAVADAYERWTDISEVEAARILAEIGADR
jgi:putative phosphoribosyl transferase